jgi:hypothetical protein
MPLNDPIGSSAADVLVRNASDLDKLINSSDYSFQNRVGDHDRTIYGINSDASYQIERIGFEQPTAYSTSGQTLLRVTQTVTNSGLIYAPAFGTAFPFVTSGAFNATLWRVVNTVDVLSVIDNVQVANLAALKLFNPSRDGQSVIMNYHTSNGYGSGMFVWDAASTLANDNGYVIQKSSGGVGRFIRIDNTEHVLAEAYGAVPDCNGSSGNGTDSTNALKAALNKASSIGWVAGGAYKVGGRLVQLPTGSGGCRFTSPLRYGAYSGFTGVDVKGGFAFALDRLKSGCVLVADLSIQDTWAIDTDTYNTTNGTVIAFNDMPSGSRVDSGQITIAHGTVNKGYSLIVATGKRLLGGLRLIGAPQSTVDIFVAGADIGVGHSSCWASKIKANTLHHKCGVFTSSDGNSVTLDGYLNRADQTTTALTSSIQFFDIFTPDTYLPSTTKNKVFGAFTSYSQSTTTTSLTCEGNDYAHAVCNSQWSALNLYGERTTNSLVIGFTSGVDLGIISGAFNGSIYTSGAGFNLSVASAKSFQSTNTQEGANFLASQINLPVYVDKSWTANTLIDDVNKNRLIYVDSVAGNNLNSGFYESSPMQTLDAALSRYACTYGTLDSTIKYATPFNARFVLNGATEHYISSQIAFVGCTIVFEKKIGSSNTPLINFGTGFFKLTNTSLFFNGCNINRTADLHGSNEEGAIWSLEGRNTVAIKGGLTSIANAAVSLIYLGYGSSGDLCLSLTDTSLTGSSNTMLIQGNYLNAYPHTITAVKAGGAMTGGIEGRADRGVAVPAGWLIKQII